MDCYDGELCPGANTLGFDGFFVRIEGDEIFRIPCFQVYDPCMGCLDFPRALKQGYDETQAGLAYWVSELQGLDLATAVVGLALFWE